MGNFILMHLMGDNRNNIFQYIIKRYGHLIKVSKGTMQLIAEKIEARLRTE